MPISDKEWQEIKKQVGQNRQEVLIMKETLTRMVGIIDGRNGEKGLKQTVTDFMSLWATREEDKKTYDDRQDRKSTFLVAIATLIFLLLAFLGIKAHLESHGFLNSDSEYTSADYNIK